MNDAFKDFKFNIGDLVAHIGVPDCVAAVITARVLRETPEGVGRWYERGGQSGNEFAREMELVRYVPTATFD